MRYLIKGLYFAHPIDFFAFPILQKMQIYHVWFLFAVTPRVDSVSRHFGAINNKMVSKVLGWDVSY